MSWACALLSMRLEVMALSKRAADEMGESGRLEEEFERVVGKDSLGEKMSIHSM